MKWSEAKKKKKKEKGEKKTEAKIDLTKKNYKVKIRRRKAVVNNVRGMGRAKARCGARIPRGGGGGRRG